MKLIVKKRESTIKLFKKNTYIKKLKLEFFKNDETQAENKIF